MTIGEDNDEKVQFGTMAATQPRLLLLSNSTMPGTKYMEWVKDLISSFLKTTTVREVLFIPFAGITIEWDDYTSKVQEALGDLPVKPIHKTTDYLQAVQQAQAIMIGGGNTFHLLHKLYEYKLLEPIRERVLGPSRVPYIGWSAGSNVAGPDIGSTNDMPVIWPPSDRALGLVPYNLNPHYNEWKAPNCGGESRIDRLNECVKVKQRPIVGYAEGVAIRVENGVHQLVAPPLQCFPDGIDNRCVKVWTHRDGNTEIIQVPLDSNLNQFIS